jgi:hypothetical protein
MSWFRIVCQEASVQAQSRNLALAAAAVALLWAPLAVLHPIATDMLEGDTGRWLVVHWVQLLLAPVLTLVLLVALRGLLGAVALVAQVAAVWVALFSPTDAVAGTATGLLLEGGSPRRAGTSGDHVLVSGAAGCSR